MNWLINELAKIRLLKGDFDYNLVRASMVIIYFFFGYQKWFDYEAKELVPILYAWTTDLLDVRGVRHQGLHLLSWRFGVADRSAAAGRILEQKGGSSRGSRI